MLQITPENMFSGIPSLVSFVDVIDVLVGRHVLSGMCSVKDKENRDWEGGICVKIYVVRFGFDSYRVRGQFYQNILIGIGSFSTATNGSVWLKYQI